jgi:hypothetical protein
MSLVTDISSWATRTLNSLITTLICAFVIALLLYMNLPDKSYYERSLPSNTITPEKVFTNNPTEETRLRLIFRTNAHLTDTLGVSSQDIVLNGVTNKTWTDTGLECPQPYNNGKPLATVPQKTQIPGWLISWKLGSTIYEYNTSSRGDWVLCNKIEIPKDIYQYRSPTSDTIIR